MLAIPRALPHVSAGHVGQPASQPLLPLAAEQAVLDTIQPIPLLTAEQLVLAIKQLIPLAATEQIVQPT